MTKKPYRASHVEQRHNTFYAVMYVPSDVRLSIGKAKFYRSTKTSDRREAEAIAGVWVMQWKKLIDETRSALKRNSNIHNTPIDAQSNEILDSNSNLSSDTSIGVEKYHSQPNQKPIDEIVKNLVSEHLQQLNFFEAGWIKNEKDKGLAAKTIEQMQRDVQMLYPVFRNVNMISSKNVEEFLTNLGTTGKHTASSLKRVNGSFRSFFNYLQKIKEISPLIPNPFVVPDSFRISNKPNSKAKFKTASWLPFEPEDVVKLYRDAYTDGDFSLANLILIGAYTGARIEEICSIKCVDVDLQKLCLTIEKSKTAAGRRTIPIHSKISGKITELVGKSTDGFLMTELSVNKYGDRSNAIGKRFGRLKIRLKYGERHVFHSIRKTLVTLLENQGIGENITADIVGHEKPLITYGLYSGGTQLDVMRTALEKITYDFPKLQIT